MKNIFFYTAEFMRITRNMESEKRVHLCYMGDVYILHTDADGYGVYGISKEGETVISFVGVKGWAKSLWGKIKKEYHLYKSNN